MQKYRAYISNLTPCYLLGMLCHWYLPDGSIESCDVDHIEVDNHIKYRKITIIETA